MSGDTGNFVNPGDTGNFVIENYATGTVANTSTDITFNDSVTDGSLFMHGTTSGSTSDAWVLDTGPSTGPYEIEYLDNGDLKISVDKIELHISKKKVIEFLKSMAQIIIED